MFLKIFTSILNNRLIKWSIVNSILTDAQFGFRTGSGTVDAIFALHGLIEKYISSGKKLYRCFINYKNAFGCIDRKLLSYKLARLGISGKLFDTVFSLYSHVKSCVKYNDFFEGGGKRCVTG